MHHRRDEPTLAVSIITPPYDSFGPSVDLRSTCQGNLALGTIFGLEASTALEDAGSIERVIVDARASYPAVPLVLWFREGLDADAAHLIQRASQLHVRGVVVEGEPPAQALRRCLTTPVDLAADVVEWLTIRLPILPLHAADLCRVIFRYAREETTVGPLLAQVGESARTARARLHKLALPPPGSWHQVARAIRAALEMQHAPQAPLFDLAIELGYSDHSALCHKFVRLFGLRASQVRHLIGWEWLLESWLGRQIAVAHALP